MSNTESPPQSQLMNDKELKNAGVVKGDIFLKWYGIVPIPKLSISKWVKRNIIK